MDTPRALPQQKACTAVTFFVVAMILIVALAAVISGVVAIGMRGAYRQQAPGVANGFAVAARHLNGDAEPPAAFLNAYEQVSRRREPQNA